MTKAIGMLAALAVATLLIFGPGRQLLPGGVRLESSATSAVHEGDAASDAHGPARAPSGIGLAPAAVLVPAPSAARLAVSTQPLAKTENGYVLEARLAGPDGKAIGEATVRFYELVELFGQREMLLGAATTDGRGVASYAYLPARTGTHLIVARFGGRDRVTAGEGRMTFEATVATPETRVERSALAAFSDRVPYAVGVIVLAVWGLIGYALFATARGVIGGARETP